jgi:hypothetical protein
MTRGFNQIPLGGPGTLRSKGGRVLQPVTYPVNGKIGIWAYRLGLKTNICHKGRVPRLGVIIPNWRTAVSDQEHRFRLVLVLTAGSETAEAAVTPS